MTDNIRKYPHKRRGAFAALFIACFLVAACSDVTSPNSVLELDSFSVAPTAIKNGGSFTVSWTITTTGPYNFDLYLSKVPDASQESILVFSYTCANAPLLPCSDKGGEVTCLFSQNMTGSLSIGCGGQSAAIPWTGDLYAVGWAWSSNGDKFSQEAASVLVTLALY